jgi:hypothetical protein
MAGRTNDEAKAFKYLLNDLTEVELQEVEERSFHDVEFSDLLSETEDDLIDAYVRKELSSRERERFERYFLVSERRLEMVGIARALETVVAAPPRAARTKTERSGWNALVDWLRAPHPALSYAAAGVALLFLVGGLILFSQIRSLRTDVSRLSAERETLERQTIESERREEEQRLHSEALEVENSGLRNELAKVQKDLQQPAIRRESPVFAFFLSPGFRSGQGPRELVVPAGTRIVRIELKVNPADDYPAYQAELQTAGGEAVRHWTRLRANVTQDERIVPISVPARLMKPGSYEVTLKGIPASGDAENLGYYYMNVVERD